MKRTFLRLALSGSIGVASVAQPLANAESLSAEDGKQLLLEQIRLGETLIRDDVVDDAVRRLYRTEADHPEGLLAQLRIATRLGQRDEAQALLEQLERVAPGSDAYRTGQMLITLMTPEANATLTQGRLFSAVGRVDAALDVYDALFDGVYPTADLTLEYWRLYARTSDGRPVAIRHLDASLQRYPAHAGMLLAIATMLFSEDRPDEARHYLRELAKQDAHREGAAKHEYDYLLTVPVSAKSRLLWQDFVATYAGTPLAAQGQAELVRHEALLNDPAWQAGQQGLAMIESGKGREALARLKQAVAAYPDDVEFLGALGVAYLRSGDRKQALYYFEQAKDKEPRADKTYRWVSLIQSTQYWLLLEQASNAAENKNWTLAERLYQRAHRQQPQDPFAVVGLGDTAMATNRDDVAWRYYQQALRLAPSDGAAQRGVLRYLDSQTPEHALYLLGQLPNQHVTAFADARRRLTVALLMKQADQATKEQRWADAIAALQQAQELDPDDPWLSYRLAQSLLQQGRAEDARAAFQIHLARHRGEPGSHYAHALFLTSAQQWQDALDSLAVVPKPSWSADMKGLETRIVDTQWIEQARTHYDAGRKDAAIALLEQRPDSIVARLQVAGWSYEEGNYPKALANYNAVLRMDKQNLDAQLGQWETWAAQGKSEAVRHALSQPGFDYSAESTGTHRRVADLWVAVGDPVRARDVLSQHASGVTGAEPLLFRDLARLTESENPQQALDLYARSMRDANLLPAQALQPKRDNVAFTRAMRLEDTDGWLERGVRRDAQSLYEQQNPTLTVHNDHWWRSDGTRGMSRLSANTTMLQMDYPIRQGKGFLRVDHVRMDAGTLKADADGIYRGSFGTCSFGASNTSGGWQASPGCQNGLKQRADGTSVAVGWHGKRLSFDLGTTPLGFTTKNWTGGISYKGNLGPTGWRLTGSRRPMSNSLLSFSGATDPITGIKWGGVMATGAALGLSWDQGEKNGVWADISHHRLDGKNVANNHRTRLMGGYYRRLINNNNEQLSVGINAMHWRYKKDLGDYTFGQGGYYSPKRYSSVSLPVSYAKRTADWSFLLEGSVSASFARTGSSARHSRGIGYRLAGFAERRLNNHWVAGGGIDWRRSKDYSPSRFMLYVRYSFEPWQGDLPFAGSPLIPYADFK